MIFKKTKEASVANCDDKQGVEIRQLIAGFILPQISLWHAIPYHIVHGAEAALNLFPVVPLRLPIPRPRLLKAQKTKKLTLALDFALVPTTFSLSLTNSLNFKLRHPQIEKPY